MSHYIWLGISGGFLACAHCIGMCGGFVLHLSRGNKGQRVIAAQLLWQLGRISTYAFLGGVAGYAGAVLDQHLAASLYLQKGLSLLTGAIIVLAGMTVLGLLPVRKVPGFSGIEALASPWFTDLVEGPRPGGALMLGMLTGLLPCPIVLAFLAYSLQSGSALAGTLTMASLGLGTLGPLLILAAAGTWAGLHLRKWGAQVGGVILILLGVATVVRGSSLHHTLFGCPPAPKPNASEFSKPCCNGIHDDSGSVEK